MLLPSATHFVDIENARTDDQKQVMEKIIAEGHCPFCLENLTQYHKQPWIKDGQYWIITPNQWPYKNTRLHFLAIAKKHIEEFSEVTPESAAELFKFLGEVVAENQIPGGGFAMRFGDTNYSAGTVKHLHAQFIVPEINNPDFEPVRFKIGKNPNDRKK